MTVMNLSIAMGTYNGEAFLAEQLDSIASQTLAPDELVVCDDASTDGTLGLLEAFAERSPFPVRIYSNDRNIGSTKNFERAMLLCGGELIALADQDDVWLPGKLAAIAEAMSGSPAAGMVFSDAALIDAHGRPLGGSLWRRVAFTERRRALFDAGYGWRALLEKNMVTGATMAFRKRYLDWIVPIPPSWVHDAWSAFVILLLADAVRIDEPLILYRQHAGQQIGAEERAPLSIRIALEKHAGLYAKEFNRAAAAHRRLKKLRESMNDYRAKEGDVRDRTVYSYIRSRMPRDRIRRLPSIAKNLCSRRYHRYARGFLSAAKDLFLN